MAIAPLNQKTAKFLTTAQVVTSVSTAVKELVENAIDAGADSIDVKLEENGASLIEVSDNGKGIAEVDTPFMAMQSYTSKIRDFGDLDALQSYGFRGEALSSLCSVADVVIITKTDQDEAARLYKINHDGSIKSSELSHRSTGTTIQARSMFKDIPVRRQLITSGRRSNQDVKALESLLRSFGICHPKMRISYRVNGAVIFTKPSTKTMKESLAYLFGKKFVSQMDFVEKVCPEVDVYLTIPRKDASELSETCASGQYMFINQRSVSYKEIEKALNRRLVEYFGEKIPAKKKLGFLLSLVVLPADVDVNLEPNKTSVLLTNKAKIVEILDNIVVKYYGIVSKAEDAPADQPGNDSTAEYHDCTTSEMIIPKNLGRPSTKKRSIEDRSENLKAKESSAVKRAAAFGAEENTPKKLRTAKRLFETPGKEANESNKENHFANLSALQESLPKVATQIKQETLSQMPEVDLGEDFSTQEISNLPNLDPEQVAIVLRNGNNENVGPSKFQTAGTKISEIVTDEAWSKGQVPINLHGGTDVHIYNNFANDSIPNVETTVEEPNSTVCTGFSKFSKEIRPQIISENPGINFVETAKMLTARWKELSPEERGYYRDLAAAEKEQRKQNTSIGSTKVAKRRVSSEDAESNKRKFLNMLDKMKNTSSGKRRENLMMRTVVPLTLDLETVRNSFRERIKSGVNSTNTSIVLGGLNENVWLARTGFQIWALSLGQLFEGLGLEKPEKQEITRESIEKLMQKWLREKEGLSLLHPVFELG